MSNKNEHNTSFNKRFQGKILKSDDNGNLYNISDQQKNINRENINNNEYKSKQDTFIPKRENENVFQNNNSNISYKNQTTPINQQNGFQINQNNESQNKFNENVYGNNNQINYSQDHIQRFNQQININESYYNHINNNYNDNGNIGNNYGIKEKPPHFNNLNYNNNINQITNNVGNITNNQNPLSKSNQNSPNNLNQNTPNNLMSYENNAHFNQYDKVLNNNNKKNIKNNSKNKHSFINRIKAIEDVTDTYSSQSEPVGMIRRSALNYDMKSTKNIPSNSANCIKNSISILNSGLENSETKSSITINNICQSDIHNKHKETTQLPYTLKEQKNKYGAENFTMATSLGPDIGTDAWLEKKAKQVKALEFSQKVREHHQNLPPSNMRKPKELEKDELQVKAKTLKEKAKEYSQNIPKPKVRIANYYKYDESEDELDQLELQHEQQQSTIEAIKRKVYHN